MAYICFVNFFTVLYAVVDVEIDDELITSGSEDSLGYYGLLFLAVWRNSIGKLGVPKYQRVADKYAEHEFYLYLNVFLIWLIYFIQIMFMMVIGLNFMIAIIESTFSTVTGDKMSYLYRNKAEMNLEAYEILQYFSCYQTCIEYRAVIFSTFIDDTATMVVVHGREEEIEDLLEKVEKRINEIFVIQEE